MSDAVQDTLRANRRNQVPVRGRGQVPQQCHAEVMPDWIVLVSGGRYANSMSVADRAHLAS